MEAEMQWEDEEAKSDAAAFTRRLNEKQVLKKRARAYFEKTDKGKETDKDLITKVLEAEEATATRETHEKKSCEDFLNPQQRKRKKLTLTQPADKKVKQDEADFELAVKFAEKAQAMEEQKLEDASKDADMARLRAGKSAAADE